MTTAAFNSDEVFIVFVLGGPGSGKGTQCINIKRDYNFVHLSAGDLLREEQQKEGSEYGELIDNCIREGNIAPMEIIIALITNAIKEAKEKHHKTRFLVDGFPREIHQADIFEETVVESKFILYFEASKETLLKRLLKRGESSGRADDNIDSIKKRFRTFEETSYPVIEKYILQDKVKKINAEQDVEDVYQQVKTVFDPLFR